MPNSPDVTAILTAHGEGFMAGPAARSLLAAVDFAAQRGINCEIVAVLDRADELTNGVVRTALGELATVIETDEGDPGQARNAGILASTGRFASFLDADDLWSENWVLNAYQAAQLRPEAVFHSECNIIFGEMQLVFWHIDSEAADADLTYLDFNNYWDALCFADRDIFLSHPFRRNDLANGFGHEDWLWNAETTASGIPHKPVPETIHFKRSRRGSQMRRVNALGGVRMPVAQDSLRT